MTYKTTPLKNVTVNFVTFKSLFSYTRFECGRQFNRRNLLIFLLALSLSYYFLQKGLLIEIAGRGPGVSPLAVWSYGFAKIQLMAASLLSLLIGFRVFRHREFSRFLYTVLDRDWLLATLLISSFIPFVLYLALHEITALIVLFLNGVILDAQDHLHFFIQAGMVLSVSFLFYLTGVIAGSIKSKARPVIVGLVIWFVLVFTIPGAIHEIQSIHSFTTSGDYNLERLSTQKRHDEFSQLVSILSLSTFYQEALEFLGLDRGLPKYFWTGAFLRLFYTFVMLGVIHHRWYSFLFSRGGRSFDLLKKLSLSINRGERLILLSRDERLIGQTFSALCGKAGAIESLLLIDGQDTVAHPELLQRKKFVYICNPNHIPGDIKTIGLVRLISDLLEHGKSGRAKFYIRFNLEQNGRLKFVNLPDEVQIDILSAYLFSVGADIYMADDLFDSPSSRIVAQFAKQLQVMAQQEKYLIYVTCDTTLASRIGDRAIYLTSDPLVAKLYRHTSET